MSDIAQEIDALERRAEAATSVDGVNVDKETLRALVAAWRERGKVFLSHFWERWREIEGYETRALYVMEHLGHTHEYCWPEFVGDGLYEDEDFDEMPMTEDEIE